jgi:ribosomal protein S1
MSAKCYSISIILIAGLCHISQMSISKINHPSEVIRVGERVYCKVVDVDVRMPFILW